ncbi:zinc finger 271-like [Paramuricea clavata]|uniref:Zinc finger 271-like n=1 Tax=Paramuricea clavata TaxID=317549 RepID=A0A7D9HZV1_PARCT|nr:zinc finger 271-like [Paramuricea clavata]
MSSKRKGGKRTSRKGNIFIESFSQPSSKVQYAEASTQTEEEYTDDDYYSCFLKPELMGSVSYENQIHTNQFNISPVKLEPTIQHIHCKVTCSEERDPQAQEDLADPPRRVNCNICNKWFSSVSSFLQHKSVHTGERPHQCEFCHKTFRQQGNLASHRRTHIGLKPYKCDICDKRFANSSNVVVHKRTHTGEKPFECDLCHKRFSQFAHLVGHKRTHTGEAPFQCDICKKRFNNPSNLTTHKRIHGGDRPYQCDICNKTFKQSGHLSSHRKSHGETQPLANVKIAETVTSGLAEQCSVKVKQQKQKR